MVTNPITPPIATFSGNFIPLKFVTDAYIDEAGVSAVNHLIFRHSIPNGTIFPITYGDKTITFTAVATPNDSGLQFPSGNGSLAHVNAILPFIQANYTLSNDFEITIEPLGSNWDATIGIWIRFEAKTKNFGFDFKEVKVIETMPTTMPIITYIARFTAGKPPVLKPNFGIFFELYIENAANNGFNKIYEYRLPVVFGSNTDAFIDISDKLHDALQAATLDIPANNSTTPILCNNSTRMYYYRYAESWGVNIDIKAIKQSPMYTVTLGKLSYIGAVEKTLLTIINPLTSDATADRFLKQGAPNQTTRVNQPQFLYFLTTRPTLTGAKLNVTFYNTDTTVSTQTLATFTLENLHKYAFNVRFDKIFNPASLENVGKTVYKYDIWLSDAANVRKSETRTYNIDYSYKQFVRYFIFQNSLGAIDTLLFYGKQSNKYEITQSEAKYISRSGYTVADGETQVYGISLNDSFKAATGWLANKQELTAFRDFALSTVKFRCHSGRRLPIKLTSKSIEERDDKNNLYALNIEYAYLFDDDAYTEMEEINDANTPYSNTYLPPKKILPMLTFKTYAEMLTISNPLLMTECRVIEDENKGLNNTIYHLYPDGKRIWIAATDDN